MNIGGNIHAQVQLKKSSVKNSIGTNEYEWKDGVLLEGWLDLSNGDSKRTVYNAKVQESTHIFICDYMDLNNLSVGDETVDITSENSRIIIQGQVYDILLIDNPMNMNEHLEIYLKFVGGQNGNSV